LRKLSDLGDRARDRLWWTQNAHATRRFIEGTVERIRADVIHAHFGMAAAQLVSAPSDLPLPLVTTFYGVDASACLQDPTWMRRFRPLWATGTGFVVLTEAVVPRLVQAGAPRERVHVWDVGIDFSPYGLRSYEVGDDRPYRILCAARFVEKKGHRLLLDAFAEVREKRAANLTLVGYGPMRASIETRIEELGLAGEVTVIDTSGRDDFHELYRSLLYDHDVFALPSTVARDGDDEGGPALTAVYAQATGMPVVLTAFPGAERSVEHGVTGLISEYDASALAKRLLELAVDRHTAERVGRAGAQRVRHQFSLSTQLKRLEGIYEQAIARHETRDRGAS
jgi:colanic acid/amylovoran biosynthesis glycosyltransferase